MPCPQPNVQKIKIIRIPAWKINNIKPHISKLFFALNSKDKHNSNSEKEKPLTTLYDCSIDSMNKKYFQLHKGTDRYPIFDSVEPDTETK